MNGKTLKISVTVVAAISTIIASLVLGVLIILTRVIY